MPADETPESPEGDYRSLQSFKEHFKKQSTQAISLSTLQIYVKFSLSPL
jgi:hypothetical protein